MCRCLPQVGAVQAAQGSLWRKSGAAGRMLLAFVWGQLAGQGWGVTGQGEHFKIAHSGSGTRNRTAPELGGVVGLSQPQGYAVNAYMCSPDRVNPFYLGLI